MPLKTLNRLTSTHRSQKTNYQLGGYLAFVAGTINAGGFLAISQYTSHMSGIISSIGDNLAIKDAIPILGALSMLVSFIFGSFVSTVMVSWGKRHQIYSEYALPLLLEAILLLMFGVLGANLNVLTPLTVPTIALMLCFVMGLQNAIITKISSAEIRTTHMTGIVTDIGIELGRMMYWNRSQEANKVHIVRSNQKKLKAHLLIFGMFLTGGVVGAISFQKTGYISVVPISISLIVISSLQIYRDIRKLVKSYARVRSDHV